MITNKLDLKVVEVTKKHQLRKEPVTYEVLEADTGASHEDVIASVERLVLQGKMVGVNLFQQL